MKKFTYDIIKQPSLSNRLELKIIFIPCYFEEDIVKVKDDDKVEWNLLEFRKFRAFLA